MVSCYLKRYKQIALKYLLLMLLPAISLPILSAELSVNLDKHNAEMGKFIIATIEYRGDKYPADVNLSEWHETFYVDRQDAELSEMPNGQKQSVTRVRLYPRVSGNLELSSLALGGAIAKSQQVIVQPSVRNNIDATPVLHPVLPAYWTDQAIRLTVDVALHDEGNNVIANDFESEDFLVRTLKPERLKTSTGSVIRLQWVLLTPHKGIYNIELPSIQQRGRARFRYYLPKLKLNIKPLPAYIPATVPVGRINVSSELVNEKNQPALWELKIENSGRLPSHIEGVQTFFDQLEIPNKNISIKNQINSLTGKVTRTFEIQIPDWNLGYVNEIEITYFDTTTGRLEILKKPLPKYFNVPKHVLTSVILIVILLFFYIANRIDKLAEQIRNWHHFRLSIQQSKTGHQLRKILLTKSYAKSLAEWAGSQQSFLEQQVVIDLNQLCFSASSKEVELAAIKRQCLDYYSYKYLMYSH